MNHSIEANVPCAVMARAAVRRGYLFIAAGLVIARIAVLVAPGH